MDIQDIELRQAVYLFHMTNLYKFSYTLQMLKTNSTENALTLTIDHKENIVRNYDQLVGNMKQVCLFIYQSLKIFRAL